MGRPGRAGRVEQARITLPTANTVLWYGVEAVDEHGNHGPLSNLVPVYARELVLSAQVNLNVKIFTYNL